MCQTRDNFNWKYDYWFVNFIFSNIWFDVDYVKNNLNENKTNFEFNNFLM